MVGIASAVFILLCFFSCLPFALYADRRMRRQEQRGGKEVGFWDLFYIARPKLWCAVIRDR